MDTAKQYWDLDPSDGVVNSGSMLSMFQGLYDVGLLLDDRDHVFDLYCDDGRILYCLCRLHLLLVRNWQGSTLFGRNHTEKLEKTWTQRVPSSSINL
mmetsp:Transcript_21042/g.23466  ORF Transcript_21042/g.23466 Transcript_21042/m.23466 type:complete len:97 (-) Transcript_21042:65-355(-)